jgi:two-component system, NtrC family, nitrogen regulation sensor histidine kinase NtrY
MVYRNFKINIIIRILILFVSVVIFSYLIFQTALYVTTIIMIFIISLQIYNLFHYVDKTNRDLTRFLLSIKHDDFSQTFISKGYGKSFNELYSAFASVINDFRKIRADKEEHSNFLQIVIQHIGVGLISFKENGEVNIINNAAQKLLKIPRLKNIKDLEIISKELVETLFKLEAGEKALIKINENNKLMQLAIHSTEFVLREQKHTLVSIQNIQSELEEKEMEAWQNLIRVLTHEIMNSATPITSLASTINEMFKSKFLDNQSNEIDKETITDISLAIQTIQKRSQGLVHFVDSFRRITRIPRPNLQTFKIGDLFTRVEKLMQSKLSENNIIFNISIEPENLELTADPDLIEQVLINLILNSIQALINQSQKIITLSVCIDKTSKINISVHDNGPGILEDVIDKIFIPFFTTKKDGSGIGLSLSRQIMKLHKGTLNVTSKLNEETVFILRF